MFAGLKSTLHLRAYPFLALLLAPRGAEARLNLPQRALVVPLSAEAANVARRNFVRTTSQAKLPADLQRLFIANLPRELRGACAGLMETWGNTLSGTEEWSVRALSREPTSVWLAFRCRTRFPDWKQYYDERLAAFRPEAGVLEFFPLGPDAENDSSLYHVEFAESIVLEGVEGEAFRVTSTTDNPCCGGPTAISEERLVIYIRTTQGFKEALSVLTRREENDHDDVDGDTDTVYSAEVKYERDSKGKVASVVANFREAVNGKRRRTGRLSYRWAPTTFRFEEVK